MRNEDIKWVCCAIESNCLDNGFAEDTGIATNNYFLDIGYPAVINVPYSVTAEKMLR